MHWPVSDPDQGVSVFDFALTWRIFGFCLSFLLAWMVYRFVETPIRTGQIFTAQTGFIRMTFSLSALLIATAFGIWSSKGLPQRFDPQVAEVMAYREDGALLYRHCTDQLARSEAQPCILGDTNAQPDMLVFGDSHANAFAAAISQWLKRQDRAAYFSFSHGCLPVRHFGDARCLAQAEGALRFVRDNPAIETVMLVSIWRQPYEAGLLYKGGWTVDEQAEKYFADQLEADVRTFRDAGKVVILVEPFFASPADVSRTMAGNLAYGRNWPIDTPLARHRAEFGKLYAAFTQAAGAGALRISLVEDFCPQELCRGNLDGRPVFTDTNHLAHSHSSRVSFIFEREIGALEREASGS